MPSPTPMERPRGPGGQPLTTAERIARGKAARIGAPRSSHGEWAPAGDRPDPVALLEEQGENRVPELVPVRHGRMLGLAVRVLPRRGADHGGRPRGDAAVRASTCSSAATRTCRTSASSASPERKLLFDINDFDETLPGPWEWDVKRLAASFEVPGRELGFGHGRSARRRHRGGVAAYRKVMRACRRDADARRLVRPHRRRRDPGLGPAPRWPQKRLGKKEAKRGGRATSPRHGTRDQHARLREAGRRASTGSCGSSPIRR